MSHDHALYTDLLALLRDMLSHYHRLLELSQRERAVLTEASLPTLLDITTQKETIVLELAVMEEGRQLVLRKLAEQLGIPTTELTLVRLSQGAPEPFADEFRRCRAELLDLIQAVSQMNTQNTVLLSSSLDAVRTSLSLISRLLEPAPVYGNGGHLGVSDTGGRLLHKQV
jgi:flagellar biosynthesis/type III secretory pathway chaperone